MYLVKQFKAKRASYSKDKEHWIWVRISRKEAEYLIQSLSGQLATNDPNSRRAEIQWTDSEKPGAGAKGFFSICVQDPFVCHTCGDEYEPYTGTRYPHRDSPNIICPRCAKKVCPYCRYIVHRTGCIERIRKSARKWRRTHDEAGADGEDRRPPRSSRRSAQRADHAAPKRSGKAR